MGDGSIVQIVSENDTNCTIMDYHGKIIENVNKSDLSPVDILFPDEINPLIIPDYPYGFTLRCQMKIWIEYREKFGVRIVTQTSNPKKSELYWNKPKVGNYHKIVFVALDENKHYSIHALGSYYSKEELTHWHNFFSPYYPDTEFYNSWKYAFERFLAK